MLFTPGTSELSRRPASLEYDRRVKAKLYARHRVREFWIVDGREGEVTVHRQPDGDAYGAVSITSGQDALTIDALPGLSLRVADVFPG